MRFLSVATLALSQLAYFASAQSYYGVYFCHGADLSNSLTVSVSSSTVNQNITVAQATCQYVSSVGESGDSYDFSVSENDGTHSLSTQSATVNEGDAWNLVTFVLSSSGTSIEQVEFSSGSITAPNDGEGTLVIANFANVDDDFTPAVNLSQVDSGSVTSTEQLTDTIAKNSFYQTTSGSYSGYLIFSGSAENYTSASTVDITVPDLTQVGASQYVVNTTANTITYTLLVGGTGANNDGAGYSLITLDIASTTNGSSLSSSSSSSTGSSDSGSDSDSSSDSSSGSDDSSSSSSTGTGAAFSTASISPLVFVFASLAAALTIYM